MEQRLSDKNVLYAWVSKAPNGGVLAFKGPEGWMSAVFQQLDLCYHPNLLENIKKTKEAIGHGAELRKYTYSETLLEI